MKSIFLSALMLFVLPLFFSCQNTSSSQKSTISEGEQLYLKHCVICHGKDGQLGAAQAKNLATSSLSEEETLQAIQKGSPKMGMPAYEKRMSAEELKTLTTYVMGLRTEQ